MWRASIAIVLLVTASAEASAQCRTLCARGEGRDPYGCCVPVPARVVRRVPEPRPESLVGDDVSVLGGDAATEAYHWAGAWLARARAERTSRTSAATHFRRAAGAALVFLAIEPAGPRAGRMRAVLVQGLDGAGLSEAGEREAAALGGPRLAEPEELRTLRADMLLNLAWAHQTIAQRLERSRNLARRDRAASRFRRAADYYRLYAAAFPELASTPSARSELAAALVGAGDPAAAGEVLEELARTAPSRRLEALARAVDAYQRALRDDVQSGAVQLRTAPPPPSQRPPFDEPLPFPPELQRVVDARDRWLAAVEREAARAAAPREQALENALWSYRYGWWDDARERMRALLADRCDDRSARVAFEILALMDPPDEGAVADVCSLRRGALMIDE